MFTGLRQKIILLNSALFTLILLSVFAVLGVAELNRITVGYRAAMSECLTVPRPMVQSTLGEMPIRTVRIVLDAAGSVDVAAGDIGLLAGKSADKLAARILNKGAPEGSLGAFRYLYLKDLNGCTVLVLAERSAEWYSYRSLLSSFFVAGGACIGCILLISWLVAEFAVCLVQNTWERQHQFLSNASHELKTPLSIIITNINVLMEHPDDTVQNQMKWVRYIARESEQMKRLVQDILFLAKNESTYLVNVPMEPVDLTLLAEEALLTFESFAYEKDIRLEGQISPAVSVPGYGEQLRRLTVILLDNACKYTPPGGAVLLALERLPNGVKLIVSNSGPVIPPDCIDRLFDRFYRLSPAGDKAESGHGLGLSIAKSIVDLHGGKITASSTQERGTVFCVILPNRIR